MVKTILKAIFCCAAVVCGVTSASAQVSDWRYEATIYLFMPETKTALTTPAGAVEGSLSFSEALSNLDFAFMGAFGASNGTWSFLLDYMYTDLSFGTPTSGLLFNSLDTSLTNQLLSGYVAYRVYETADVELDLAGGFRWFDTQTTATLTPGLAPGSTTRVAENWVDPIIAARARFNFSDRWMGTAFVDYGGFSSDSETWQVLLTADFALTDRWILRGGYRYISVDHVINGNDFAFSQSGPLIGATYRF